MPINVDVTWGLRVSNLKLPKKYYGIENRSDTFYKIDIKIFMWSEQEMAKNVDTTTFGSVYRIVHHYPLW